MSFKWGKHSDKKKRENESPFFITEIYFNADARGAYTIG